MKRTLYHLICLLFIINFNLFAQTNLIYNHVIEARNAGQKFSTIPSSFLNEDKDSSYAKYFRDPEKVSIFGYNQVAPELLTSAIILTIPSQNGNLDLELIEAPETFKNYTVKTNSGEVRSSNRSFKHYRGIISGKPESLVAISFLDGEIMGIIATSEDNINLVRDPKSGKHLLYSDKNLKMKLDFTCSEPTSEFIPYRKEVLLKTSKESMREAEESRCIRLYFETEQDVFTTRGSVSSVEGFVSGIFNQVSTLYANENIQTGISEIFVWTTADPYTATNLVNLLGEFQTTRTSFNGALGQLLTFRNVGGGRAASFNGLCNTNVANRLSVAQLDNGYSSVPSYSWTVYVVTHEFGHLFGSRHTHTCVWNGTNTAIDGCGAIEPTTPGGTPCADPGDPAGGGTIMSYCHLSGVGLNFSLGFGTQPGNVIRDNVNSATCICTCPTISGPSTICTTGTFSILGLPAGSTVTWSSSNTSILTINSSTGNATKAGNGQVTVTGTISNGCGNDRLTWTGWVGAPAIVNYITITPSSYCTGTGESIYTTIGGNPSYSQWSITSGNASNAYLGDYGNGNAYFSTNVPDCYGLTLNMTNVCGSSVDGTTICKDYCFSAYKVFPNPAKDYIAIQFEHYDKASVMPDQVTLYSEKTLEAVYKLDNNQIFTASDKDGILKLDVKTLPRGTYYVHITSGKEGDKKTDKIRILLE